MISNIKFGVVKVFLAFIVVLGVFLSPQIGRLSLNLPFLSYELRMTISSVFKGVERGIVFPSVKAAVQGYFQDWYLWDSSRMIKNIGNGWVMPFEVFDERGQPQLMDINGDGLFDAVYSRSQATSVGSGSHSHAARLLQFVLQNRGNGSFELVYKCVQTFDSGSWNSYGAHTYYGDCADTQTAVPAGYWGALWSPFVHLYQYGMGNMSGGSSASVMGLNMTIANEVPGAVVGNCSQTPNEISSFGSNAARCDRNLPRFIDANGDGLVDVLFNGLVRDPFYLSGTRNMNMVLYNNGAGFSLGRFCGQMASTQGTRYQGLAVNYPGGGFLCADSNTL
jgi:hypothetical protein